MPSHLTDPEQKVGFADNRWLKVPGGGGAAAVSPEAVYLAMSVRNVGNGIAILHSWRFVADRVLGTEAPPLEEFHGLTRDLYVPVGDVGFWQGVFRDPDSDDFRAAADAIEGRQPVTVDVLYGDHEGGQRVITRFSMTPRQGGESWMVSTGRHWNIDRDDPR
jgi:hypothetical protein